MDNLRAFSVNTEKIRMIYEKLSDPLSRKIYRARLLYSLTGDSADLIGMSALNSEKEKINHFLSEAEFPIFMWGAGENAKWMYNWMSRSYPKLKFAAYIDSFPKSDRLLDTKIISAENFFENYSNEALVLVNPEFYHKEIIDRLRLKGVPEKRILDLAELRKSLEHKQYFEPNFLPHASSEVFVDAGAYDGQTALNFMEWGGGEYSRILCFEPDEKNLTLCREKLSGKKNIHYFNKGLWDKAGVLKFSSSETSSGIDENGNILVPVVSIDEICRDMPVTFIKMDIEGSELRALKGARETIRKNKPKLAICVYHKAEDLFEIPEEILKIDSSYKLYLRHYCFYEDETVLYAV